MARKLAAASRSRAAFLLPLLGWGLFASPAQAQLEQRVAEREAELAQVEVAEVPLQRHLLSDQELVVWLPQAWQEDSRLANFRIFSLPGDHPRRLTLSRFPAAPGAGLLPFLQELLADLETFDFGTDVDSVRRTRIAGRDAFEVAGTGDRDGAAYAARLVVSMDPDDQHYRTLFLRGPEAPGDPLDATYQRLIRDWSPLDDGAWSRPLELLRESVIDDRPSLTWAERNRHFAAMARPEAVGQPWFTARLRELAREDPLLLLDGVFHHHPRVRAACVEALAPAAVPEPVRTGVFTAAMQDADPAVRLRAARHLVADADSAAAVLARLLETDSEASRGGAFQLLAAAPDGMRGELVAGAFADRRHAPEANLPFLAATLARWGAPDDATLLLRRAWKTTRFDALAAAAWRELLDLGDAEALAAARQRLERPLEPSPLPLRAAAVATAVHAEVGDAGALRRLLGGLEPAQEGGAEREDDGGVDAALRVLEELVPYLEALPADPTAEAACAALATLDGGLAWVEARSSELGCSHDLPTVPLHASVARPGAYAFALRDLLQRLEVGSSVHNQAFHAILDRLDRMMEDWAGDPITSAATGIDLDAPWRIQWWSTGLGGTGSPLGLGRASLHLTGIDSARLLDTILRVRSRGIDLMGLSQGVVFTNALPLLPLGLLEAWSDEQRRIRGTDDDSATPAPTETYVALGAPERRGETEDHLLHALELGEEGSEWRVTHVLQRGAGVVLSDVAEPPPLAPETAADGDAPAYWTRLDVDLSGVLEELVPRPAREAVAQLDDLSFSAGTTVEPDILATGFQLGGLPEAWLSIGENRPADDLRAPAELLPEDCLAWMELSLNPSRLAERLGDETLELFAELPRRRRQHLLGLAEHLSGEAGLAVVGIPDPRRDDDGEGWTRHVVGYLGVEPAGADRFLRRTARRYGEREGRPVYELGDAFLARVGGFLVAASDPEVLAALGRPPFLATSPTYRQVVAHAPADAVLWAGWDTDKLADVVKESLGRDETSEGSTFTIELFRSFGAVAAWARRGEAALSGELATRPRLQSEATQARVRRLTGYGDLTRGSVRARGLPPMTTQGLPQDLVEITLHLPGGLPEGGLDWANERLDQERLGPGEYRFVSRPAAPLPESSPVALPITDPDLLPFTRNERDLELHSDEIRRLAETIRGDEDDPARIVRAIVEWAHEGLDYTVVDGTVSTERILATRQADCTEFSQLTIAVARSLGIPARPVTGASFGAGAAYLHRWLEVYLDRWYEIDPTWGIVQVPATSLRLPQDDALFLVSLPGARLTIESVAGADGGFARRLVAAAETAPAAAPDLAVDGDRVLVALPAGTEPSSARRLLVSSDAGRTFTELTAPDTRGTPLRLLGGHGRLLWVDLADEGGLAAYELGDDLRWVTLRLPPALQEGEDWTVGLQPGGYLALAADSSRIFVLDRNLELVASPPLPAEGAGDWVLAREQGLLAHSVKGVGIALLRWDGDGWTEPREVADTAHLVATDVRAAGDQVEIACRPRPAGAGVRLSVGDGSTTRRSLSPDEARALAATTTAGGAEWTVWSSGRDRVLTRRPLLPMAHTTGVGFEQVHGKTQ